MNNSLIGNNILKKRWICVCNSKSVKKKPIRVDILDTPIVIIRMNKSISAFIDSCPHRNVPLSIGKVSGNHLECSFHGWKFNAEGKCVSIPGRCEQRFNQCHNLHKLEVYEDNNLVWVSFEKQTEAPYISKYAMDKSYYTYTLETVAEGELLYLIENFLDGTHTHFVHSWLVRSNKKRQKILADIYTKSESIEIFYQNEGKQNGIISKLFETTRTLSIAKFILPSVAELEYRSIKGTSICITVYFTECQENKIKSFILISIKKSFIPGFIKSLILNPFLKLAIKQDKKIVKIQTQNIKQKGKESFINTELDIIRPYLLTLFKNGHLKDSTKSIELFL